jgi:ATP-GRASP peptide maturase of grasp-with-spasm system
MQGITTFNYNPEDFQGAYFEQFSNKIYLRDIKIVWYRKFGFLRDYEREIGLNNDLLDYVYHEFKNLYNLLLKLLGDRKSLCVKSNVFSKLHVLAQANSAKLKIPKTIITTNKQVLLDFYLNNNKSIITKSIGESRFINYEQNGFMVFTHKVNNLDSFPENFSPSLFQEYIDKEIEIRTFYLDGECFSMAIFSQNNEMTKLDFRNYDRENPNRLVPYKLPEKVENAIVTLMESIDLNTGSLDIVKSAYNGEYYFLEVNPSGQFGMTSFPCNYDLHKKVAEYLINNTK